MSKPKIAVHQLGGCDRCLWHTLAIGNWDKYEIVHHSLLNGGKSIPKNLDVDTLVLTGFATREDTDALKKLNSDAARVVAFGTCPATGGIFGLANQRGGNVISVCNELFADYAVMGCPPSSDALQEALVKDSESTIEPLCKSCNRSFEEETFYEIVRPFAVESAESCYNRQGHPCSGVVSGSCAQRCVDFNTPCRGCVNLIDCPSLGMVGYFGTMARNIEVETVANIWTTDKLGDGPDDLTDSMVDVVGTFFRFHLACAFQQSGTAPSTGNLYSDIMIGRPIEEAIQIAATIYGSKGVDVALTMIDAYESAVGFVPTDETIELRQMLKNAQDEWSNVKDSPNHTSFTRVSHDISKIGGNEVLSNAFFFGFRTPIKDVGHPYDSYKFDSFEPIAVKASYEDEKCCLRFSTDEKGILREWSCEF
ncbi:MAG: hypothetical protein ACFE8Z_02335 [Candidatus Hermodarchaeota archaeon]